MLSVSVQELHRVLAAEQGAQVIDVRERSEVLLSNLDQRLPRIFYIPLSGADAFFEDLYAGGDGGEYKLDKEAPTFCLCHHGVRSARVARVLLDCGFRRVYNIEGGIDAYARHVDPGVGLY